MDLGRDLILFAFDRYDWNQLRFLVNSIRMSGFNGDVVAVAFNATKETLDKLTENGVMVVIMEQDAFGNAVHQSRMPIHTERFFHFFNILKDHAWKYKHVITVDAKDVIFQKNPTEWLNDWLINEFIVAGSECIRYKDEEWGNLNMEQTFGPYFHDYFKNNVIYNVGVIAGESQAMRDMCLNIFLMSTNRPQPICDQAVFNAMLYTRPYQEIVKLANMNEGWVCHLGTVMDPTKIDKFRPFLTELPPHIWNDASDEEKKNECYLATPSNDVFYIVHQYDRVPVIKEIVEKRYG